MSDQAQPAATGQTRNIVYHRPTIIAVSLVVSYLMMVIAPFLGPVFPFVFVAASGVVLGGLWLLAYTWIPRVWAALSFAAGIYLILGLVWVAVLGATNGIYSVTVVLVFPGAVIAAFWPVLRRHEWAMTASMWGLVVLGVLAIVASGIVAGNPILVAEGLLYTAAWPTMALWFHGCDMPLVTACLN